ncbi:MAG: SusC/RagA family TonB-linked outer membrane protein, partial [Bacteroidales bacterium]
GGKVFDSVYQSTMQMRESGRSMHKDLLNAWTPQNTNTSVPVLELGDNQSNGASDYFLASASFFNIRNISLGYTIPKSFANKMQISSLRLYAVADNVALFSARKGLDPRQYDYGTSGFNYSPIRSISFGINLTL